MTRRYRVGDRVRWSSVTHEAGQTCEFTMVVDRVTDGAIRLRLLARPDVEGRVRSACGAGVWPFEGAEQYVGRTARDRRRTLPRRSSLDPLRPEPAMSIDQAQATLRAEGALGFTFAPDGFLLILAERQEGGQVQRARIEYVGGDVEIAWRIRSWQASS